MKEIKKAIRNWINKNKENVSFVGSFTAFDKKGEVKDSQSRVFCFGDREIINISLKELNGILKKEKGEFINY